MEEFFTSSLCTVMLDDAPLPGAPQGSMVLLEAGSPFLIGVASTPEELAAFMREDHVPHYLVDLHDGKSGEDREGASSSVSLIGDLPRGSVSHRSLGGRSAVVYTERLADKTISYSAKGGSVIATVTDGVSHYTGIPGLTGVWVEVGAPHVLRWAGGSWTSGSPIDRILPGGADDNIQVITADGSHRLVGIGGTAEATDTPQTSSSPILWCPSSEDPAGNVSGTVITRILPKRTVDITLTGSTRGSVPLVWFDSSWALPIKASAHVPIDLGSLQPGNVRWCHAGSRPVVRVGIDYQALAEVSAEDILSELHLAWEAALGVIATDLPDSPMPPFLGGDSFGAALAAVSVLRGMSSPRGVLLRSGAYDRYATPSGFEQDRRTSASDPSLYSTMTILPSARAHRGIPFLLTCGDSDENSATTPEQSLYLYENLLVAGADVTLSVFPGEGHIFSSRQSIVDRRRLEENWMSERIQSPQQSHHQ
nr:prolyl oligopeptidase family serine peptidase [Actinomyces oris]